MNIWGRGGGWPFFFTINSIELHVCGNMEALTTVKQWFSCRHLPNLQLVGRWNFFGECHNNKTPEILQPKSRETGRCGGKKASCVSLRVCVCGE